MVSPLASGARDPRFDPRSRRGIFPVRTCFRSCHLQGMTLNMCAVLRIGTLKGKFTLFSNAFIIRPRAYSIVGIITAFI